MKQFILILITGIFSLISCEEPDSSSPFGQVEGYALIKSTREPLSGLQASLPKYGLRITDENGYFCFKDVDPGEYTLTIFQNMDIVNSEEITVERKKTTTVWFYFEYKKSLPEISVIDIKNESSMEDWDYMVSGREEFYLIRENSQNKSLPKEILLHSFNQDKDYYISFRDDGLPKEVHTEDFIFLFDNFNGRKVDMGIIYPDGTVEIFRELENKDDPLFNWNNLLLEKSTSSSADVFRWGGRVLKAIPCIVSGATALASGGIAVPLALWTCGNYFLSLSANLFDDFHVHNGFTDFMSLYGMASTNYSCVLNPDPSSCILSLAGSALERYADYVEHLESQEADIQAAKELLANIHNPELKSLVIQPGPEGKDAYIQYVAFTQGGVFQQYYYGYGEDTLLKVIYYNFGGVEVFESLIMFPLHTIPQNVEIVSAELSLYGYATINYKNTPVTIAISRLTRNWEEHSIKWDTKPESQEISSQDFTSTGAYSFYVWNVTSVLNDWLNGEPNYGLGISSKRDQTYGRFYSGDYQIKEYRPKLTIYYYE